MTITKDEFRRRLNALGYITQEQAAEALLGDPEKQYNVSRWLSGARTVPDSVARTLELLEADPVPVLSWSMRVALEQAERVGAPVPWPESDELNIRRVDWLEVYNAMEVMGLIAYDEEQGPCITERGWRALHPHGGLTR